MFLQEIVASRVYINFITGNTTVASLASTPLHPGYRTTIASMSCGIELADPYQPLLDQTAYNDVLIEEADRLAKDLKQFVLCIVFTKTDKNYKEAKESIATLSESRDPKTSDILSIVPRANY